MAANNGASSSEKKWGVADKWDPRGDGEKRRFMFTFEKYHLPGPKYSPIFYWGEIKSPRSFCNKNHSKLIFNLVAVKRTKRLFFSFPRILWLG